MNPEFMRLAIEIATDGVKKKGTGPFGAVIVKGGELVGIGTNNVTRGLDPTAHAEICAIRDACLRLRTFSLSGLEIYTSCEPCPMCMGAIYWARLDKVYYGATRADAAKINFDDHHFYEEIKKHPKDRKIPMNQIMREECIKIFDAWTSLDEKVHY